MPYAIPSGVTNPINIGTGTAGSHTWAAGAHKVLRIQGSVGPPDTNNLVMRTSIDGSTFVSAAASYQYNHDQVKGSALTARSSTSDTSMAMAISCGSAAAEGHGFDALLFTDSDSLPTMMLVDGAGSDSGSSHQAIFGGGQVLHSTDECRGFQVTSNGGGAFVDGDLIVSEYTASISRDTTSTGVRDFAAAVDLAASASGDLFWTTGNGPEVLKIICRCRPADTEDIRVRISTDGSTFVSSSSYDWDIRARTPGGGAQNAGTGTSLPVALACGGAAGEVAVFEIHLYNLKGGNGNAGYTVHSIYDDSAGNLDGMVGGGYIGTASEILGVQVLTSGGGNFNAGYLWYYDVPVE
jgi:hypothetical protein